MHQQVIYQLIYLLGKMRKKSILFTMNIPGEVSILSSTSLFGVAALNVYTVQNPRRRVVSVKTSQMRTICTLIWRES